MDRRIVHAIVLNAALFAGATFYLFSPAIFAYVGEVGMTYTRVPRWFAKTTSARLTARVFEHYNDHDSRVSRLQKRLSCSLADDGATPIPGCLHLLRSGHVVSSPALSLPSGVYQVMFQFEGTEICSGGEAYLEVLNRGRFGGQLASDRTEIQPDEAIELPFRLHLMDAALGEVQFRVTGISGCTVLKSIEWSQAGTVRR